MNGEPTPGDLAVILVGLAFTAFMAYLSYRALGY